MRCIKCDFNNSDTSKFCASCGTKMDFSNDKVFICNCGAEVLKGSKFCSKCGNKFNIYNVQNSSRKYGNKNEQQFLYLVLAFIVPVFGICYFFITRKTDKRIAVLSLIIGIFSIIVRMVYYIICFGLSLLE